ncbi:MAG: hypothetical protein LC715_03425 [Gammaproteobacteria bacterium]|nr:hypothetical protein [Gammaproteobacteria bacterium]
MPISDSDLTSLAFLESIESGQEPPDGCDLDALLAEGLVMRTATRWILTHAGHLRLTNLRSLAHSGFRMTW